MSIGSTEARQILDWVALPALQRENPITASVVAALPVDRLGYQAAEGGRSAWDLARHIVAVEQRFIAGAVTGAFPESLPGIDSAATPNELAAAYRDLATKSQAALARIDGAALLQPLDYKGFLTMPALGFVQLAINHTIHHRGQYSVYLRGMGVRVPSIYG